MGVCLAAVAFSLLQQNRTLALDQRTTLLADAGAELATSGKDATAQNLLFRYWANAVIFSDAADGCLLVDDDGHILQYEPPDLVVSHDLPTTLTVGTTALTRSSTEGTSTERADPSQLVWSKTGRGAHLAMLRPHRNWWADLRTDARWVIPITLAMIGVGTVLLHRMHVLLIDKPLAELLTATAAGAEGKVSTMGRRPDEFGQLARNVDRILNEWHTHRARAGRLERTLDQRVAQQTRQIESMLEKAEREAWIDPLTSLGNRRLLNDRLGPIFEQQQRNDQDLSIVIFDVDNFKPLNDQLGHAAGDEVLQFIGELLNGCLRSTDIGLRYGGDEFVALLLDTSSDDAALLADRITKLFAQRASLLKVQPRVSMSAGVASLREHKPRDGDDLLALADAALYVGKNGGKSQVSIYRRTATSAVTADH